MCSSSMNEFNGLYTIIQGNKESLVVASFDVSKHKTFAVIGEHGPLLSQKFGKSLLIDTTNNKDLEGLRVHVLAFNSTNNCTDELGINSCSVDAT